MPEYPQVTVAHHGVPALEVQRVAGAVGRLLRRYDLPESATVRVAGAEMSTAEPAGAQGGPGPMLTQVSFQVDDVAARAQTVTPGGGVVLPLVQRMERQITSLRAGWQPREWPDPARSCLAVVSPGAITRRKKVTLTVGDPRLAVAAMDAMDYDVHLFTDADSGEHAVVYRTGPGEARLARRVSPHPGPDILGLPSLTTHPQRTATLRESDAVDTLCATGSPFVFYTDHDTGLGRLLYRRYDGNLTLVSPDAPEPARRDA